MEATKRARTRASDYRRFLERLELSFTGNAIHLVLADQTIHKMPLIQRWLAKHPRYHAHFAPTYSSWLRSVEWWFTFIDARQLHRGVDRSTLKTDCGYSTSSRRDQRAALSVWAKENGHEPTIREDRDPEF